MTPKWADRARARDEFILRTFREQRSPSPASPGRGGPDWWEHKICPRLKHSDGCLIGALDGRYVVIALPQPIVGAHRVMVKVHRTTYLHAHGEVPYGHVVDHLCQNTRCCDIRHSEAVTQKVNMSHRMDRGPDWLSEASLPRPPREDRMTDFPMTSSEPFVTAWSGPIGWGRFGKTKSVERPAPAAAGGPLRRRSRQGRNYRPKLHRHSSHSSPLHHLPVTAASPVLVASPPLPVSLLALRTGPQRLPTNFPRQR